MSQTPGSNHAVSPTLTTAESSVDAGKSPALSESPVENDGVEFFDLAAPGPKEIPSATQDFPPKDDKRKEAGGNVSNPVEPSLGDNVELF
jgi:hypothetical protein